MIASNMLLLILSVICATLYGLSGLIRAFRKHPNITFIDLVLVFMMALFPLVAVVNDNQGDTQFSTIEIVSAIIAIGIIIGGVVIALLELRRPQRLKQSRGILGMGTGVLMLVMIFITFNIARAELQTERAVLALTATSTPTSDSTNTPNASATPTLSPTPSNTVTRTPILLNTPVPLSTFLATSTPTPHPDSTATPTPTRVSITPDIPCLVVMNFNVNLRETPTSDGRIIITIPFETTVFGIGRTSDSAWWQVVYGDFTGWVFNDVVTVTSTCRELPLETD